MITFNYVVTSMLSYPEYQSETDVVFEILFNYVGSDIVTIQSLDPITKQPIYINKKFTSQISGNVDVTYKAGETFTPYYQLTQSQVIGWIEATVNPDIVAAWQTLITNNINNQINPTEQQLPLPWTI